MSKKKFILTILLMLLAVIFMPTSIKAATNRISSNATSVLNKNTNYKLHLKVPGRMTVETKSKLSIKNSADWKLNSYSGKTKNTKIYYMRAGNYTVKVASNSKIKTSFTKLTNLRQSLDTYPVMSKDQKVSPAKIELVQTVNGMLDMYHTYRNDTTHAYEFDLNKPQKVTIDVTLSPLYQGKFDHLYISNDRLANYLYELQTQGIRGKVHKTFSWYLDAGTYKLNFYNFRGLYNFKISGENTDVIPESTKITSIIPTDKGITLNFKPAKNANKYGIYFSSENSIYNGVGSYVRYYTDQTTYEIPKSNLINGDTVDFGVIGINSNYNNAYGPVSPLEKYTYYVPLKPGAVKPNAPQIALRYNDDNGNDEPTIIINWQENKEVDSYEVAYRVKGNSQWNTFLTSSINGTEILRQSDFKKGTQYEIRVRALTGKLTSDWSDIKTVLITNDPA